VLLIAHRTPLSVAGSAALARDGAGVFEIDVQVDGEDVVVSHFVPVTRLLPRLRRDGWVLRWGAAGAGAERLAAAVDLLPAGSEVLLDLKDDTGRRGDVLVELILRSGIDPARCYVSSKQWSVLSRLRDAGFRTWRTAAGARAVSRLLTGPPTRDHGVTVRHSLLDGQLVGRLQWRCGLVVAWTVNSPGRAAQLAAYGVDGITSDHGAVLRSLRPQPAG
jgi:hypothetical protein